jgi:hypothetical protein
VTVHFDHCGEFACIIPCDKRRIGTKATLTSLGNAADSVSRGAHIHFPSCSRETEMLVGDQPALQKNRELDKCRAARLSSSLI